MEISLYFWQASANGAAQVHVGSAKLWIKFNCLKVTSLDPFPVLHSAIGCSQAFSGIMEDLGIVLILC